MNRRRLVLPPPSALAWQARAECRDLTASPDFKPDHDPFFPERGKSSREARAICARCKVVAECRAYGLGEQFGIIGGTSERQRRRLRAGEPMELAARPVAGSRPSQPLRTALKQLAPAYGSAKALSRHVAARTDMSPTAVAQFMNGGADRPRVTLKWTLKVLTALDRTDLLPTLWPDDAEAAA